MISQGIFGGRDMRVGVFFAEDATTLTGIDIEATHDSSVPYALDPDVEDFCRVLSDHDCSRSAILLFELLAKHKNIPWELAETRLLAVVTLSDPPFDPMGAAFTNIEDAYRCIDRISDLISKGDMTAPELFPKITLFLKYRTGSLHPVSEIFF